VARLSDEDWGKIHAKAWLEPEFRKLLESDPTKAVREYERSIGKPSGYFDRIVRVGKPPSKGAHRRLSKEVLERAAPWPPWCC
jgi:hypothetical protein